MVSPMRNSGPRDAELGQGASAATLTTQCLSFLAYPSLWSGWSGWSCYDNPCTREVLNTSPQSYSFLEKFFTLKPPPTLTSQFYTNPIEIPVPGTISLPGTDADVRRFS